jgi:hypothetical protein
METFNSMKAYWTKRKEAGDIAHVEFVMLASTGNHNMPAGFMLVTGERSKLQQIRWEEEEFLDLHTKTMVTMRDYACIDGYAGTAYDAHMQRLARLVSR